MEGVPVKMYRGLRQYWKRKDYERLDGSGRRRKNRVQLATVGSTRRRRFWRIKVTPRLRFLHLKSVKKLLSRLRDGYVNMMLGFARSSVGSSGYAGEFGGVLGGMGDGFSKPPLKEYDEKVIIEIYKSLMMAKGHLVPRDAATLGGGGIVSLSLR